jgi:uncharacterized protein
MAEMETLGAAVLRDLLAAVLEQYVLDVRGIHGPTHWARVLENGYRLAPMTGARLIVLELFALFHDSCRHNDEIDPDHGERGARLLDRFEQQVRPLVRTTDLALAREACAQHTEGLIHAEASVGTCWDADRLDLARCGIMPAPEYLCSEAARMSDMIDWANDRALRGEVPVSIAKEWNLDLGPAMT